MRCRRICRELLWLARFGEFGPSSAPHLDHLAYCGNCRDEVGFDRALVQQLRTALAERAELAAPSPGAWSAILERAQAPERGIGAFLHRHAGALAARLRTATAITAVGLAGVIATSTHVTIAPLEAGPPETRTRTSAAGEQFERQAMLPRSLAADERVPVVYIVAAAPSDPEMAFLVSASMATMPTVTAPTATTPETVIAAEPQLEPSMIRSTLVLGMTAGRTTLIDPVGGGQPPSAPTVVLLEEVVIVGEPF
ncbi:MAG: hypothetical protein WKH68_11050 [Candidatus Limnocylindria bacterium]